MFRFIFLNVFIVLVTIVFSLWGVLLSLFDASGRLTHFYAAAPWGRVILWACGVKVRVKGLENVNPRVPHIYMTNHQSYFDIFTLLASLPVDFKFILKQELMKIPIFSFAVRRAGYISIDRDDPRKALKSMTQAAERIRSGSSVLVFPEGTRSRNGRLQEFKRGGFHLALKAGVEVVPVGIINTHRIAPKGSLRITPGTVSMNIGAPICVKNYTKREMDQLIGDVWHTISKLIEQEGA
jgi:1-acyl-sn-glycerol-3-phosphate acyltransferase